LKLLDFVFFFCLFIIVFGIGVLSNVVREREILPDYQQIARGLIINESYDIQNNNCVNYSKRLMDAYEEHNYESRIVTGYISDYCKIADTLLMYVPLESNCKIWAHAWVEVKINDRWVGIEPITGEII